MSTLKVDALQDTSGKAFFPARVWVNFNGTGTIAIRDSGNVSSLTDHAIGKYSVNFTNALSSANYCVPRGISADYVANGVFTPINEIHAITTSAVRINSQGTNGGHYDAIQLDVSVIL